MRPWSRAACLIACPAAIAAQPVPVVPPDEGAAPAVALNGAVRRQLDEGDRRQTERLAAYAQARADYEAGLAENRRQRDAAAAALTEWRRQDSAAQARQAAWTARYAARTGPASAPPPPATPKPAAPHHRRRCAGPVTGSLLSAGC